MHIYLLTVRYMISYTHGPCPNQRQGHHNCPHLSQRPDPLAYPCLEKRRELPLHLRKSTSGITSPWKWTMNMIGSWRRPVSN